ncbi:MoaD/ThiS family protein [Aurantiacibacter poecillastricola]|uniref:MoaD/ThiS family protein n=1 Tax=Aurantiacibacter poecillastricola TaxID=3064385 RepID=UPI00273DC41E|nr:MoaD/ThiS family protein [Aurantiacibacter sp. 219JJ12-13]MDP5261488.1 MoaD/ThiS family protein [Aurantiacibacter sp. 219JJ12-13]
MAVTVVFIGKLADLAGEDEREVAAPLSWSGLAGALGDDIAAAAADERIKIAVNGKVLADKTSLSAADGDEVALLPPVSGG